jgi:hypothetical protein
MRILVILFSLFSLALYAQTPTANPTIKEGWISTPDGPAKVNYQIIDGVPMLGGDMEIEIYEHPEQIREKGAGRWWRWRKWPNKTIPYVIDERIPNKERIYNAIKHYHQETEIKLIPRTNEKSYVYFQYNGENGGCNSFIGRRCPWCKQVIRIPDWCGKGSVVHEIGHALGLIHEHSRWDRNKHLKVHWNNIIVKQWHNFFRIPIIFRNYTPFDFDSIMMYGPYGFARDKDKPTITKRDGSLYNVQRQALSELDKQAIAKMYGYWKQ